MWMMECCGKLKRLAGYHLLSFFYLRKSCRSSVLINCFTDQRAGPNSYLLGAGSLKNLFGQVPKRPLAGQDIFVTRNASRYPIEFSFFVT